MPTYQYACRECGHAFEQVQSFSDDALTDCPECQGRLRKVFNAVGVVFKGSGFYRTDSRGKESSSETTASSDKGDSGAAAAKSTSPSTSSPATSGDSSSAGSSTASKATKASSKSPQPTAP